MKKLLFLPVLLCLAILLGGCGLLKPPSFPSTQAEAKAIVLALSEGISAASETCAVYVDSSHDEGTKAKCVAILVPAADSVEALSLSVDAWTSVDQGALACGAAQALAALSEAGSTLQAVGVSIPSAVSTAISLASEFGPSCPTQAPSPPIGG